MELLQFVFSSFWVWLGCVVLIVAAGEAVVEVENAGRADIPAAVKALNERAAEVDE